MPDKPKVIATLFVFESDSRPGKTYQSLQYTDGSTSCECPGWVFKRKSTVDGQRTCKHTRLIESGFGARSALRVVEYAAVRTVAPTDRRVQRTQVSATPAAVRRFDFSMEDDAA